MLSDTHGLPHNFKVYTGKILPSLNNPDLGASVNIVLNLANVVQPSINHILCFDYWLSSVAVMTKLLKKGIYAIGIIRANRLLGWGLASDNSLKANER